MKKIVFLLLTCAVFASACSPKVVRTSVTEQRDFSVALEQYQENGIAVSQKYSHPYEMEIPKLEKLMGDLNYVEKGGLMRKEEQSPVFQADEIERLGPAMAEALQKADASQRVRFASFNQGKALVFSVSRKTEGVLFVDQAGRLNIAFNFINLNRQGSETTAIDYPFSGIDPLKINSSNVTLSAPAPYAELHEFETGKPAPMWVVADVEKMQESTGPATAPMVDSREKLVPAVLPQVEVQGAPVEEPVPGQSSEENLGEDIKIKLRYLKELLDEGLISEQDYARKKKELLDKID